MKTIGMLGGMSWESSAEYYRILNRETQKRLGGVHSAKTLMYSFDFGEIAILQAVGNWPEAEDRLVTAGVALAKGGADFLMICCNTMHLMSDALERAARIPLLHIADPLGEAIRAAGIKRVGLIGSIHTMEKGGIISDRLRDKFDIACIVPEEETRAGVHRVIIQELVCGKFLESSRALYREVIAGLVARGAEGIIMGCTEIPLLLKPEDSAVPMFDTTQLHAMAAVDLALA